MVDLRNSLNLNSAILNEVKYIKSLVGNISKVSNPAKKETTSSINLKVQTGSNSQTSSLSVSDDGKLLITGHENGEAVVWSIQTGKEISKFYIGNDNSIIWGGCRGSDNFLSHPKFISPAFSHENLINILFEGEYGFFNFN